MDEWMFEQAQRVTDAATAAAIEDARRTPVEPALVRDGVRLCKDCEEPIPARRLEAWPKAVRCAECQDDFERRREGR